MRRGLLTLLVLAGCSTPSAPPPGPSTLRGVAERRANVALMLHRGCGDLAPENTLDACELAFALGADGVEIDLRRAADGTIVLMHDPWIDRALDGWGLVAELSYEELLLYSPPIPNRRVATFREVLELCKRYHGLLHLDLKVPGMEGDILRELEETGLLENVVTVNPENAGALRADPRLKLLPSNGSLIHGHDDYDMPAIRKKLSGAKSGTFLVDDPRASVAALRRPAPDPETVAHRIPFSPPLPKWSESPETLIQAAIADPPTPGLSRRRALARLVLSGAPLTPPNFKELPEAVAADWYWAYARLAARGRRVPEAVGAAAGNALLEADEEDTLATAAELAGEAGRAEALPLLVRLLAEHKPLGAFAADAPAARIRLRAAAARALGRMGASSREALEALRAAARDRSLHRDGAWHGLDGAWALRSLARLDPRGSAATLKRAVLRVDPRLGEVEKRADLPEWTRRVGAWWDFRIKSESIRALGLAESPEAKAALEELIALPKEDADEAWRELHAQAARALRDGAWSLRPDELRAMLTHPMPPVRREAAAVLLGTPLPAYKALKAEFLPWAR